MQTMYVTFWPVLSALSVYFLVFNFQFGFQARVNSEQYESWFLNVEFYRRYLMTRRHCQHQVSVIWLHLLLLIVSLGPMHATSSSQMVSTKLHLTPSRRSFKPDILLVYVLFFCAEFLHVFAIIVFQVVLIRSKVVHSFANEITVLLTSKFSVVNNAVEKVFFC